MWEFKLKELTPTLVKVETNYVGLITRNHPIVEAIKKLVENHGYAIKHNFRGVERGLYPGFGVTNPSVDKGRTFYFRVK